MDPAEPRLADLDEGAVLADVLPVLARAGDRGLLLGPGDDAAVLAAPGGSVVLTTDSMVRGVDWRDDWSTAEEVGRKLVVQNIADVAAMGAVPTGLLLTVAADPSVAVAWVRDLCEGVAAAAAETGAPVVGGDLSGARPGQVVVGMTAVGDLEGRLPVTRTGARPGDVVAVCGTLGRSAAGLALHLAGAPRAGAADDLMAAHRVPTTPWRSGPDAARAGARAMIDISDGLVRDAGRVARASGVRVDLDRAALADHDVAPLRDVVGEEAAWRHVLGGGEEHSLLACLRPGAVDDLTHRGDGPAWRVVGRVLETPGEPFVTLGGEVPQVVGWDHFAR